MNDSLVTTPAGVLAVLSAVAAFFFFLQARTGWRLFKVFPPLIFIYLVPVLLSNTSVIASLVGVEAGGFRVLPARSGVYSFMKETIVPVFLLLMLLEVDVAATVRVMGRGVLVMLAGTAGVVVGAVVGFSLVHAELGPEAWKAFGALAGSWIGGTGNMAAVAAALDLKDGSVDFGYAVVADNVCYLVWLPLLLASNSFAGRFNRFTGMLEKSFSAMEKAAGELTAEKGTPLMRDYLYLLALAFGVTALSSWIAGFLPVLPPPPSKPFLTAYGYKVLLVTAFGIFLSFTKAGKIPGSHPLAMALVYVFVARMGATADLSNLGGEAFWFLGGAFVWIFVHGAFLVAAAKLLKVDVHTAAIASAANIGGAASAPVVAAHHRETLVPLSVLMALLGYAIGTPAALFAAWLCRQVAG